MTKIIETSIEEALYIGMSVDFLKIEIYNIMLQIFLTPSWYM